MKISIVQTNPHDDYEANIHNALKLIENSLSFKPDVIILPETFGYMGDETNRRKYKNYLNSGVWATLKEMSAKYQLTIIAGSLDEYSSEHATRAYNTCITYNCGEQISIYRKLHLFNLVDTITNKPIHCESNIFIQGHKPNNYKLNIHGETWRAANIICYDIRFPEIIRTLSEAPDIIFVPAAFTWQTGKAHWEILLRARAIENQCFIVACNQTGTYSHNGQKRNYGHSMIINPWGEVLLEADESVGLFNFEVNKQSLFESRSKLPALKDRLIF